jgi:type IV secretory pathway TraG/TraD family ATPase VirD4
MLLPPPDRYCIFSAVWAKNPYWDNVARDLLVGLTLLVLEAGPAMGWPVTIGQVHRPLRAMEVRSTRHVVAGRRGRVRVAEVA